MIRGEAGLKKARGGKPIEQILPITKEQLKAQIDEDDRDITLDYDIFQKIKKMEKGKNGKKSTGAFIQPSILKKKQEQKENTDQAYVYRERIDQYAAKMKKFGDTRKFIFRQEPRAKNWEER